MGRLLVVRALALLSAAIVLPACRPSSDPPERQLISVARPAGSWQGTGNRMIGLISDTGRFRISWNAWNERPPGSGRFRLTVESSVSGRPIEVVVDHRGEGSGRASFVDDPRLYNLVVDSANIEWSFSVEEVFIAYATGPSSSPPRNRQ